MSAAAKVEYVRGDGGALGATWNPVTGCSKITGSAGCELCFAATFAERWRGTGGHPFAAGFDVHEHVGQLRVPLGWRRPRRVLVGSVTDLGHRKVSETFLVEVFAVMAYTRRHTFLVETKRPGRLRSLLAQDDVSDPAGFVGKVAARAGQLASRKDGAELGAAEGDGATPGPPVVEGWPLPNVWLGVSVEDQAWAGARVPVLLATPAAVRFVTATPLLGPVDLSGWLGPGRLDWVVAGGEYGHGARPMHPAWPRALRDQCSVAGVPFLFKQWGSWRLVAEGGVDPVAAAEAAGLPAGRPCHQVSADGTVDPGPAAVGRGVAHMMRVPLKVAGRELDGRKWDDFPSPVVPPELAAPQGRSRGRG